MRAWHHDPPALRDAYTASARELVVLARGLPAATLPQPALPGWSVRDLLGHAGRSLTTVATYLDAADPGPVTLQDPLDYFAILSSGYADGDALAERARQAGAALGEDPATTLADLARTTLTRVARARDDAPVATPAGTMRLIDYLPSRVLELTVHRLDLVDAAARLGVSVPSEDPDAGVALSLDVVAGLAARGGGRTAALLALAGRRPLPAGFSAL